MDPRDPKGPPVLMALMVLLDRKEMSGRKDPPDPPDPPVQTALMVLLDHKDR